MAVVVTAASGFDLGYVWKNQAGQAEPERSAGGYYINAAQAGEPPGRWWGPGARALGFSDGQVVERRPYEMVYRQLDPRTGEKLGRSRGNYAKFADHLARLQAAEPHATTERLLELEREAAQATRQAPVYTDMTVSLSKSISVFHASIRENERRARLAGDRRRGRAVGRGRAPVPGGRAGRQPGGAGVRAAVGRDDADRLPRGAGRRAGDRPVRGGADHGVVVAAGNQPGRGSAGPCSQPDRAAGEDGARRQAPGAGHRVPAPGPGRGAGDRRDACGVRADARVRRAVGRARRTAAGTRSRASRRSRWTPTPRGRWRSPSAMPAAVESWTAKYGRAPNQRELLYIRQEVTLASRHGKDAGVIDWDALTARVGRADRRGACVGCAARVEPARRRRRKRRDAGTQRGTQDDAAHASGMRGRRRGAGRSTCAGGADARGPARADAGAGGEVDVDAGRLAEAAGAGAAARDPRRWRRRPRSRCCTSWPTRR